ncbi:MAG: hypothetical protein ACREUW_21720, partial [Burkholderiales bacterium]
MSGFSADWLQRREPYDAAARSGTLAREFGAALGPQQSHPKRIIDLAAGSGANFRVLAPLIGGDQDWLLVDHDPQLIATQAVAIERWAEREGWRCSRNDESLDVMAGTSTWRVRARRIDLAHALEQIDATDCD